MFDRILTSAGAVSAAVDGAVRSVLRGGAWAVQPASVLVAAVLAVLAGLLLVVALESSVDAEPRRLGVGEIAGAGLGARTHATVAGGLSTYYVEMFEDLDANGQWDEGEATVEWDYFLVDPATSRAVTVRSERPPEAVYTLAVSGYVVEDPTYVADAVDYFRDTIDAFGLTLDRARYVDATLSGAGAAHDLATDLPRAGTPVALSGARSADYLVSCSTDPDGDGTCDDDEVDRYDVLVFDPVSRRAVTVVTTDSPEFAPLAVAGVLRRDSRAVALALDVPGMDATALGFTVDPTLVLDEGAPVAASGGVLVSLAALAFALAAVIVLGAAGGYVRFRPDRRQPAPATSGDAPVNGPGALGPGERRPLRITGWIRGRDGMVQVREAAADLVRFVLAPAGAGAILPGSEASTLIVERRGRPEGVALGRGELVDLVPGAVRSLRGTRPALRATAGTGTIVLTFDDVAARDQSAAELFAGSGLAAERPWPPGN